MGIILPCGVTAKAATKDITGIRFGMLVAVRVVGKAKNNSLVWECTCDCGMIVERKSSSLSHAKGIQSCGCYLRERRKTHLRNTVPWNKGKRYSTKPDGAVFVSKKAWRDAVVAARGNVCQECGWDEAPCDVHHIVPMSDGGRNTIENAVVLCPNHHRIAHYRARRISASLTAKPMPPLQ